MSPSIPSLRVSNNRRFLVRADGRPFFWLADTAWELLHRASHGEVEHYLRDRARKGFTVIQTVALAELDGLGTPNAHGHRPFVDFDPLKPTEAYWSDVDRVISRANALGLVVALLPTWGDKWNKKHGTGPEVFTPENALRYGEWLGRRYRNAALVWMLGGDRPVETNIHREIIRQMAAGLTHGDGGSHLRTFHSQGAAGSAQFFHDEDWLDFNCRQNGHGTDYDGAYDQTRVDYDRKPAKPVIDAEPVYEGIGIHFDGPRLGYATASHTRHALYWDLFSGACGHTYGHHSVWQFWQSGREPVLSPTLPWQVALDQPGAGQMIHARRLLESRPYFTRIPDQSLLAIQSMQTGSTGAGRIHLSATRDCGESGAATYALVYTPARCEITLHTPAFGGARRLCAWWFNPRDGSASLIGEFARDDSLAFSPPEADESLDWVLVLDDASCNYPPPGQVPSTGFV